MNRRKFLAVPLAAALAPLVESVEGPVSSLARKYLTGNPCLVSALTVGDICRGELFHTQATVRITEVDPLGLTFETEHGQIGYIFEAQKEQYDSRPTWDTIIQGRFGRLTGYDRDSGPRLDPAASHRMLASFYERVGRLHPTVSLSPTVIIGVREMAHQGCNFHPGGNRPLIGFSDGSEVVTVYT